MVIDEILLLEGLKLVIKNKNISNKADQILKNIQRPEQKLEQNRVQKWVQKRGQN